MIEIIIILNLSPGPISRIFPAGIPALGVNTVDTEHLNPAFFQVLGDLGYHTPVFPLVELSQRTGKD
jgi:hypothetical protein